MEGQKGDIDDVSKASTKDVESGAKAHSTTNEPLIVEDVPDPEEDDLDDLDDMLDEFSATKIHAQDEVPKTSGPDRPTAAVNAIPGAEGISDKDFAKQLEAGMAELLGGMETSSEMQAQFETMLRDLGGAAAFGEAAGLEASSNQPKSPASASKEAAMGEKSFQDTINKTMERMQASGQEATAAATADDTDDILAEIMKQMAAGGGMDGEGNEEDFSKMLLGMMEQLTNKEILYDPMKELHDKFPEWMEKNKDAVSKDDLARYKEQQKLVAEIVAKFEEKTYTDSSVPDREYIVERMQKMQAAGSPPADLVGDMASAQEAFGAPEEGCPQQ